jgi:hypothetical protein
MFSANVISIKFFIGFPWLWNHDIFVSLTPSFRMGMVASSGFKYWINPGQLYLVSPYMYACFVVLSIIFLINGIAKSKSTRSLS